MLTTNNTAKLEKAGKKIEIVYEILVETLPNVIVTFKT